MPERDFHPDYILSDEGELIPKSEHELYEKNMAEILSKMQELSVEEIDQLLSTPSFREKAGVYFEFALQEPYIRIFLNFVVCILIAALIKVPHTDVLIGESLGEEMKTLTYFLAFLSSCIALFSAAHYAILIYRYTPFEFWQSTRTLTHPNETGFFSTHVMKKRTARFLKKREVTSEEVDSLRDAIWRIQDQSEVLSIVSDTQDHDVDSKDSKQSKA